ncbi:transcriptional regulator with XRE-family HTH domain [Rhodococcus sp. 27YEA15]|uniref:helix-turn-helix domain-containing protein n=1 Tax=Rhodococcus sp. 27YEA15 TaxID=3156259 RepID=UPI003C7E4A49
MEAHPPTLGEFVRSLRKHGLREKRGGLTRDELAREMHTSSAYVAKLESGRGKSPGVSVLDSIAKVFALTPAETLHLYNLARQTPTEREIHQSPATDPLATAQDATALEALAPHAAAYLDERWNLITCNSTYDHVFPGLVADGNVLRWFFTGPTSRQVMVDWEAEAQLTVGWFRALMGRYYDEAWALSLLEQLSLSDDFLDFWKAGNVTFGREDPIMRVRDRNSELVTHFHVQVTSQLSARNEPVQFFLGTRIVSADAG